MNCIEYCLNYIKRFIPAEVLSIGLLSGDDMVNKYTSIDDKIISKVINSVLKVDLNLHGGTVVRLDLRLCNIQRLPRLYEFMIKVPKNLTDGRSIIALHHLISRIYSKEDRTMLGNYHRVPSMGIAGRMLSATDSRSIITTTRLELIGENLVLCKEPSAFLYNTVLECQIENQENLENINRSTYDYVAELALLATKMIIWSNKAVSINMGELYGGHELNIIKDLIDEYKDAGDQYKEKLREWSIYSITNSKLKMRDYVRLLLGQNT